MVALFDTNKNFLSPSSFPSLFLSLEFLSLLLSHPRFSRLYGTLSSSHILFPALVFLISVTHVTADTHRSASNYKQIEQAEYDKFIGSYRNQSSPNVRSHTIKHRGNDRTTVPSVIATQRTIPSHSKRSKYVWHHPCFKYTML